MGHDYLMVSSHGEDAPFKTLDEYRYCTRCGCLRHDYRHNGGHTSPNYPMFWRVGRHHWDSSEPACVPRDSNPLLAACVSVRERLIAPMAASWPGTMGITARQVDELLIAAIANATSLQADLDAAQKFKAWVHGYLDNIGCPADPDPEHTKATGCRISGRMKWLADRAGVTR